MFRTFLRTTLPLLLVSALLAAPSCIFDPKETDPPPDDPINWPALTEKDDVLKTVVLCYLNPTKNEAIQRYTGLLHSQFYFQFDPDDLDPGEDLLIPYADDIYVTGRIFDEQTYLDLEIKPEVGSWDPITELNGDPCENCWQTQRGYYIEAQFGDETTIYVTPLESAFTVFVVAPDESDPSKWSLRAQIDLGI